MVPFRALLLNWFLVYIGNWGGTLFMAYFFGYLGNMFGTPQYRSYLDYVVLAKLEHLSRSTVYIRPEVPEICGCADVEQRGGKSSSGASGPTSWSAWP